MRVTLRFAHFAIVNVNPSTSVERKRSARLLSSKARSFSCPATWLRGRFSSARSASVDEASLDL
jgi:hypothetical protein